VHDHQRPDGQDRHDVVDDEAGFRHERLDVLRAGAVGEHERTTGRQDPRDLAQPFLLVGPAVVAQDADDDVERAVGERDRLGARLHELGACPVGVQDRVLARIDPGAPGARELPGRQPQQRAAAAADVEQRARVGLE